MRELLPYWCPEAMDLLERTIGAEVVGFVRRGPACLGLPPMACFTVTKLPEGVYIDDDLNLSINRAAHAALLWNGGRKPDREEAPVRTEEDFWDDVVGFGDDDEDDEYDGWEGEDE